MHESKRVGEGAHYYYYCMMITRQGSVHCNWLDIFIKILLVRKFKKGGLMKKASSSGL